MEKVNCDHIEPLTLFSIVFCVGRYTACYQKRTVDIKASTNLLLTTVYYLLGQWWHKNCGSNQPGSEMTQDPRTSQDGTHSSRCWDDQEPESLYPRELS